MTAAPRGPVYWCCARTAATPELLRSKALSCPGPSPGCLVLFLSSLRAGDGCRLEDRGGGEGNLPSFVEFRGEDGVCGRALLRVWARRSLSRRMSMSSWPVPTAEVPIQTGISVRFPNNDGPHDGGASPRTMDGLADRFLSKARSSSRRRGWMSEAWFFGSSRTPSLHFPFHACAVDTTTALEHALAWGASRRELGFASRWSCFEKSPCRRRVALAQPQKASGLLAFFLGRGGRRHPALGAGAIFRPISMVLTGDNVVSVA